MKPSLVSFNLINLQVQQTPYPDAQVPAEVPLLDVHSDLEMSKQEHSIITEQTLRYLLHISTCVWVLHNPTTWRKYFQVVLDKD